MIELINVTKEYSKGNSALNGVSVKIERGEFVFIVGDSGSGKSTLIRLIMKELNPTEGTIIVNGQNLNRMKHRNIAKYRRGLGVVFQDFRLLRDRNIYENIAFALRVTETPTKVIKKKVPAALSLVGLAQKYKSFPKELSGGEQQRVAIASPLTFIAGVVAACAACALVFQRPRRGDLLLGQHTGYLGRPVSGKAKLVNLLDYRGGFLVNDEILVIVHEVAVHGLAGNRLSA